MSNKLGVSDNRPVNLALWTIKFPITAIVSILHRITGLILFIFIPLLLGVWQYSLSNSTNFSVLKENLNIWYIKLSVWLIIYALIYHLIAGLRHLLMDMHIGDSKIAGRLSGYLVFGVTFILAILLGIYLW